MFCNEFLFCIVILQNLYMKKAFFFAVIALSLSNSSCKKNRDCVSTSKARIIGYDPCRMFTSIGRVEGAGFVLEVENGTAKDTVVTYKIPEGKFVFEAAYVDPAYSSYLFRPEVQDKFKIKMNYRLAGANEQTFVPCNGMINTADFYAAVKGREAFVSCLSNQ